MNNNARDTVVVYDTIRIHDTVPPLTRTEILVQKEWRADEVGKNTNGNLTRYVRGGINTTAVAYDNERSVLMQMVPALTLMRTTAQIQ